MSDSNDTKPRKFVTILHELNQASAREKINRPVSRYSHLKSFISPRNETFNLFTCPPRKGRSKSLSEDKGLNNFQVKLKDLLVEWVTNATNDIKSSMKNEKNEKIIEKVGKEIEINLARLVLAQVKQSENNQEMIKQMQNELENIKNKLCEFSNLFQELHLLTDEKFREIVEISEKHENEINHLKELYQSKFDDLQQQLDHFRSNSVKIKNKEKKLKNKTKKIFERKTIEENNEKFEEIKKNLMSDLKISTLNQVPSLSWEITGINYKIRNRQEIWSKYFQTHDKKFTMRLWIHFRGIPDKSSMNIELLVWNNSPFTFAKFIYEEDITISIYNKMMPYCFECIPKRIRIDETNYSSIINVKFSNLNKNKVLEGDSIIIKCLMAYQ